MQLPELSEAVFTDLILIKPGSVDYIVPKSYLLFPIVLVFLDYFSRTAVYHTDGVASTSSYIISAKACLQGKKERECQL